MTKLIFIYICIHFLEHKYKFPSSKAHTGSTESIHLHICCKSSFHSQGYGRWNQNDPTAHHIDELKETCFFSLNQRFFFILILLSAVKVIATQSRPYTLSSCSPISSSSLHTHAGFTNTLNLMTLCPCESASVITLFCILYIYMSIITVQSLL